MNRSTDRLYELLPVVYRLRDAEKGEPLRALLNVIAEQVNLVEADIAQMYDNWFIETCDDWVVPYIADLIGYELLRTSGEPGEVVSDAARERSRILVPRRDVANVIRYRRRKGALALLELLARDAAGYSAARAVEFYKLLGWTQALNFQRPGRSRTVNLRDGAALDLLASPFDKAARTVDLRRTLSNREQGRFNIPGIGVFVWRLKTYSVTKTPAYCLEEFAPECYSFSVLGHDTPLYNDPQIETEPSQIADELNLPTPIRRRAFEKRVTKKGKLKREASEKYYDRSLAIYLLDKKGEPNLIPRETIIPANLSNWEKYRPPRGSVAVDPKLGRIIFPPDQKPRYGVVVSYNYAFSADIGGGEYDRPLIQPEDTGIYRVGKGENYDTINSAIADWRKAQAAAQAVADAATGEKTAEFAAKAARDRARTFTTEPEKTAAQIVAKATENAAKKEGATADEAEAAANFTVANHGRIRTAVIEIQDSGVYTERLKIALKANESLQIRAANRKRPVIRLLDYQASLPDALTVRGAQGSRFTLDGLLISGRSMQIIGPDNMPDGDGDDTEQHDDYSDDYPEQQSYYEDESNDKTTNEAAETGDLCEVTIRHCTLVPGWNLNCDCEPQRPNDASLELDYTNATIKIEHSIVGAIVVEANERAREPQVIRITDSIWDATSAERPALIANGGGLAYVKLTVARTTVIGKVKTHAIALAENSIFQGIVTVGRRRQGCVRFCYVAPGSRTPQRYQCQPDLVEQSIEAKLREEGAKWHEEEKKKGSPPEKHTEIDEEIEAAVKSAKESERTRVEPQFNSERYGAPTYCQLAQTCADEIKRGADDESEMGAFHDLYQPQRTTNLRARLGEYTPAGADVGIIYAN